LVIINRDPTPYDDMADMVIHGQAGPIMASVLDKVKKGLETESKTTIKGQE
jgi:NAD-dependent SIR2 family protein deacetylase